MDPADDIQEVFEKSRIGKIVGMIDDRDDRPDDQRTNDDIDGQCGNDRKPRLIRKFRRLRRWALPAIRNPLNAKNIGTRAYSVNQSTEPLMKASFLVSKKEWVNTIEKASPIRRKSNPGPIPLYLSRTSPNDLVIADLALVRIARNLPHCNIDCNTVGDLFRHNRPKRPGSCRAGWFRRYEVSGSAWRPALAPTRRSGGGRGSPRIRPSAFPPGR